MFAADLPVFSNSFFTLSSAGQASYTIVDGTSVEIVAGVMRVVPSTLPPAGSIVMFGGTSAPAGWLMCDGTSYLRTDYVAMYNAIGNAYGSADGSHFNVPDMRGRFPRGTDDGANRDPDHASRTAMNAGGNTGNNVGSVQADAFASHVHGATGGAASGGSGGINTYAQASTPTTQNTNATGGNETRPINAYVNFIIKT